EQAGEAGWLAALEGGVSRSELTTAIVSSPEYALVHSASSSGSDGSAATSTATVGTAPETSATVSTNIGTVFSSPTSTPDHKESTSTVSPTTVSPSVNLAGPKQKSLTVSINGAPATSPVNVPIALTSTVNDPNQGATLKYAWKAFVNGAAVASATTPNFSF